MDQRTTQRSIAVAHVLASLLLSVAVALAQEGDGPVDPFAGASPSFNTPAPEPTRHNVGEWGVAEQRGAVTYTYPITVPPGRNGMAPSLVLRYSSQSPLRGGVAVGWNLDDLPSIHADRSLGQGDKPLYKASLRGVAGRLIEVPDTSPYPGKRYRVDFDGSFTRFIHIERGEFDPGPRGWVALTSDGVQHFFEEKELPSTFLNTRWHITRQIDPHGNAVRYVWEPVQGGHAEGQGIRMIDLSLARIEYTANEAAGLGAHAKVEFAYAALETCPASKLPIGARYENNFGSDIAGYYEGARRLTAMVISVRDQPGAAWRVSKRISLDYDRALLGYEGSELRCKLNAAPLRYLTRIDVTAVDARGISTRIPPTTFTYGRTKRDFRLTSGAPIPGYGHYGTRDGAVGTLLDIDGDGIRDQVSVISRRGSCALVSQKGRFGGSFDEEVQVSPLPTARWKNGTAPSHDVERCTLNGQVTYRCTSNLFLKGIISYHFMDYTGDGRLDLLTNIWAPEGFHKEFHPPPPLGDPEPSELEPCRLPDKPKILPEFPPLQPERESGLGGDHFVWQVYRHRADPKGTNPKPNAVFTAFPMKVSSPQIPRLRPFPPSLPPSASDEHLDELALPNASIPTLTDLDGDGYIDFVDVGTHPTLLGARTRCDPRRPGSDETQWCVYFGNGGEAFGAIHKWPVPRVNLSLEGRGFSTDTEGEKHLRQTVVAALHDVNGDGLQDLIVQTKPDVSLQAYLNHGAGFRQQPVKLGLDVPLEATQTDYTEIGSAPLGDKVVLTGNRGALRRLMDVDNDGLEDMLVFAGNREDITDTRGVQAHFNVGDRFLPAQGLPVGQPSPGILGGTRRWELAKRLFAFQDEKWRLERDFTDGDADDLPDLVAWSANLKLIVGDAGGAGRAPRALQAVENGRGLRVEFTYGPSTDPEAVQWDDSTASSYLPRPAWVVTKVIAAGGHGTPVMTTRYKYADPTFRRPSDRIAEPERFLGFARAIITREGAAGSPVRQVERVFAYDKEGRVGDPSGRVVEESTYRGEGGRLIPHEYKEMTWKQESLFAGKVFFTHPESAITRTCNPGVTINVCREQEGNIHRVRETWVSRSIPSGAGAIDAGISPPPVLYLRAIRQEGSGLIAGTLDRRTLWLYQFRYGQPPFKPEDYRILTTMTKNEEAQITDLGLRFREIARTRTQYAIDTGLPIQTDRNMDEVTIATTKRTFDPLTGNLLTETKPEQAAPGGSGKHTAYAYDPHRLFVQRTTNELGHQVETTYDVATGARLERRGPNAVSTPAGTLSSERETWKTDGFGRILEHAVSDDKGAEGYALHTVDKTTYFDFESPNRAREEHLRDLGGEVWVTTERTFDGLGRRRSETQHLPGDVDAVTHYEYNAAGKLAALKIPNPRTDDGTSVTYAYDYDGLDRLLKFRRPDNTGIQMVYQGLEETRSEITTDGSGSTTKRVYDVFGRLIEVHELEPATATAITKYEYDGEDNLSKVTNADGNITTLRHDWVGNRVQIQRGPRRIWRYRYDRNSNLVSQTDPVAAGGAVGDHTTSYQFDDLDRITARTPASRGMPADRMAQLGIGSINYTYDDGRNGVGGLTGVRLPFGKILYTYNARGLVSSEERSFEIGHLATMSASQSVIRHYNALDQLTLVEWDDGQKWQTTYDERGLVDTVAWFDPRLGEKAVADYERSIASQPRTRLTSFSQSRQYSYDILGRPIQDRVLGLRGPIATRTYVYTDAGDLKAVTGTTDSVSAAASYTYDTQHRLKTASGPNRYAARFAYSLAGNVLTAAVTWEGSPATRNVRYEYGRVDPQAVDRLVNVAGGGQFAQFAYDLSGNMVERATPEDTSSFTWDGDNQLREAQAPGGTEVYYYDHNGQRMLAINETEGVRFWFAESETHYDGNGTPTRRYLHLQNAGAILGRVESGADIELQYSDVLQNLMVSLDKGGNVVASFLYGAFGEVVDATGEENHRRQFNGKENDAKTGLRYYGFRYYDPLVLRWNNADPLYRIVPDLGLIEPQRMNLYTFSLNNAVRHYDANGRQANQTEEEALDPDDTICELPDPESCQADRSEHSDDEDSEEEDSEDSPDETPCGPNKSCLGGEAAVAGVAASGSWGAVKVWTKRQLRSLILSAKLGLGAVVRGRDVVFVPHGGSLQGRPRKEIIDKVTKKPTSPKPSRLLGRIGSALGAAAGLAGDLGVYLRARESGKSFEKQFLEETKDQEFLYTPWLLLPMPNPNYGYGYCPEPCES